MVRDMANAAATGEIVLSMDDLREVVAEGQAVPGGSNA
jgi:hypothetical protein